MCGCFVLLSFVLSCTSLSSLPVCRNMGCYHVPLCQVARVAKYAIPEATDALPNNRRHYVGYAHVIIYPNWEPSHVVGGERKHKMFVSTLARSQGHLAVGTILLCACVLLKIGTPQKVKFLKNACRCIHMCKTVYVAKNRCTFHADTMRKTLLQ